MHQPNHEVFSMVRAKLDSIYDAIVKKAPESVILQELPLIRTDSWARNVQVPLTTIDVEIQDVNSSL